jgi:catechol 2,3-dioxygenase-like lactoylglutathione lyase family enzyme
MLQPNFILLYVDSPQASARFYAGLLGREPVETSPTFVLFALDSGLKLGLWARHLVEPAVSAAPGAAEIAIPVEKPVSVDSTHAAWQARALRIVQVPTDMDFGRTFVALDPDGHRLRVFAPSGQ